MVQNPDSNQCTVYVVDDEEPLAEMLRDILKIENYQAFAFFSAEDALESIRLKGGYPDVLLSDFLMSTMNGMELIQKIKAEHPQTKTILISGNVGEDVLQKFEVRPDLFLVKPFNIIQLVQAVKSLCGQA